MARNSHHRQEQQRSANHVRFIRRMVYCCKEFEKYTFSDPSLHSALSDMLLLQANVTDNDLEQQALLQKLNVYGLPTILFYYRGTEVPNSRVYGFMDAKKFNQHLELIHQKIRAEE